MSGVSLALCLVLAGCGGGGAQAGSTGGGGAASTPAPSPSPSPAPAPAPAPSPAPSPPPSGSGPSSPLDEMLEVMLRDHNAARREVDVPDLVLDDDLTSQAQAYAEELARSGRFEHSSSDERKGQGENLWAGTASRFSYEAMAGAWIDEKRYYSHAAFPYVSTTGRWQDVGHYTQIIWRNTTRLGCGLATGDDRDVLVCRYAPQGNIVGQFAY